jgi:hypothetical protein
MENANLFRESGPDTSKRTVGLSKRAQQVAEERVAVAKAANIALAGLLSLPLLTVENDPPEADADYEVADWGRIVLVTNGTACVAAAEAVAKAGDAAAAEEAMALVSATCLLQRPKRTRGGGGGGAGGGEGEETVEPGLSTEMEIFGTAFAIIVSHGASGRAFS